mmetsp:Transcript_20774/g.57432  ORF Transcript_20774/g.57432 Transcript_20774/m.57432 type:complete len:335 (+) Transcript_20774:85-1089(+)
MMAKTTATTNYNKRSKCSGKACKPTHNDCLCGKDKTYAKHVGNRLFRQRIEETRDIYIAANTKQEKMKITRELVSSLQQEHGTRFLKQSGDKWVEISHQAARDKVSHALRFACRDTPLWQTGKSLRRDRQPTPHINQHYHLNYNNYYNGEDSSESCDSVESGSNNNNALELSPTAFQAATSAATTVSFQSNENNDVDDEPIPLSHVFADSWDHSSNQQRVGQASFGRTRKSEGYLGECSHSNNHNLLSNATLTLPLVDLTTTGDHSNSTATTMKDDEDDDQWEPLSCTAPVVDNNNQHYNNMELFHSMRSEDFTDLFHQPLGNEWEEIQQLARL